MRKTITLPRGESVVKLTPSEFAKLNLQHPRLWWPNGYGSPELYHLKLSVQANGGVSDSKDIRFGVREISYELSLLDNTGHLRRVEYSPTAARSGGFRWPQSRTESSRRKAIPVCAFCWRRLSSSPSSMKKSSSKIRRLCAGVREESKSCRLSSGSGQ